ncbi:MAG: response regulator [Nitrospiraceae bacterium]
MAPTPTSWATTVLLIDANDSERTFYAEGLQRCSSDYLVLEANHGQLGLNLYRESQPRIDCVVLDLALPDRSGFGLIMDLIPLPSKPKLSVVVLTKCSR